MSPFIYLAAPYSHWNKAIMDMRYTMLNQYAARLQEQGYSVYSPISGSHVTSVYMTEGMATNHDFWMKHDLPILEYAKLLIILQLEGWSNSKGVQEEMDHAHAYNIRMLMVRFDEDIPVTKINEYITGYVL